ncbi:phasin family protein [Salipiger mucosus]|uniref:Phasin, PhaP n=1 Tax=Salipiger mucosus DSM 16094 TaxID=1123237 RepID=S9S470_9RHOB|nr:phasin family protein [Salipiger mucosus]EPX84980.1 phasin, PhaP [Salipiger mucosus DSM 16094]
MATQTDFTKFFADMPNMFDTKAFGDSLKTFADMNEKMTGIAVDTAAKTTDIMTSSAQETFGNMRKLTAVRTNPADYGPAMTDFAQAQMQVAQKASEAFSQVAQSAGGQFTDVTAKAGETTTKKAASTAKTAAAKAA